MNIGPLDKCYLVRPFSNGHKIKSFIPIGIDGNSWTISISINTYARALLLHAKSVVPHPSEEKYCPWKLSKSEIKITMLQNNINKDEKI